MPENVDVVVDLEGQEMPEMDPETKKVLEQGFANTHAGFSAAATRRNDGADNVAEQTRLGYLERLEKIGVREAHAMQQANTSKIASEVLQTRATRGQPQGAGSE